MNEIKVFDPRDVAVVINSERYGAFTLTGMGEDDIECSADNDFAEAVVGFQGDSVINESCDRRGTIKLSVQASSPQMAVLKRMANSVDIFAIWVVNRSTNEKTGGTKAFFKKPADNSVGAKLNDRSFEVQVMDYTDR